MSVASSSGTGAPGRSPGPLRPGGAPDNLDPRQAVALVRFCRWLKATWGFELYHAGAGGDPGRARTDCHGQGSALDFVGIKGTSGGTDYTLTVFDDWGRVSTRPPQAGPGSRPGRTRHFRLDDAPGFEFQRDIYRSIYEFAAGQWQDTSSGPDPAGTPISTIGGRSPSCTLTRTRRPGLRTAGRPPGSPAPPDRRHRYRVTPQARKGRR